ncbi:uncharacterized protein LOC132250842 [Alligator mississippiensis]|uniref:uncharacterized protein LOC132250842 n=1 Tax=Alligator mississippiensis TaxID=8496 RepID=UPI0028774C6C|nr:uncharacterized protein LOC132250842 [Alligator mississippiensis]
MQLGDRDELVDFLVDTGAAHSVLTQKLKPLSKKTVPVVGVTGKAVTRPFLQPMTCNLGQAEVTHQFLYMPNCPVPLLGRDLLCKLQATLSFQDGQMFLTVPPEKGWHLQACLLGLLQEESTPDIPQPLLDAVVPWVWAGHRPGKAKNADPVKIQLLPGAQPPCVKQYPMRMEARKGLKPLVERFLEYGLLRECASAFNTPILPVKKPKSNEYRFVQDLRAVNKVVVSIYPAVPNPYTLLSALNPDHNWFTVIDLKDAFFCIPVEKGSQEIFAFEWEDPDTSIKTHLCWTVLPQGFKNSPTLFGNALSKDLRRLELPLSCALLQYVDYLLLTATTEASCLEGTICLLNFLGQQGYRVSRKKMQPISQKVTYLGFELQPGQRALLPERKEAICRLAPPITKKQLRGFLGTVGFCRIWIPNFGVIAKPLYEATHGDEKVLEWTEECEQAFCQLKQALIEAPALGLPDMSKPFSLFVHDRGGVAVGVLTQKLGSWQRPVAYFSKKLDFVSCGWPACLRAVAATCLLIQEAEKLTLGHEMIVYIPHAVLTVLEQKGGNWLTPGRMARYQAILLDKPEIKLAISRNVNPATLLPSMGDTPDLVHDCLQTLETVYSSRPNLRDRPLDKADLEFYTDGSSSIENGIRKSGYAIVTAQNVIEAGPLNPSVSAQKAELIAMTRALQLAANKTVNIYTGSKYVFLVLHAHGALWRERGLLDSQGTGIKHSKQIKALLKAVWEPKKVAIMHCKAPQKKNDDSSTKGNRFADATAKKAAKKPQTDLLPEVSNLLPLLPDLYQPVTPQYGEKDKQLIRKFQAKKGEHGWLVAKDGRIIIPAAWVHVVVKRAHHGTHYGPRALIRWISHYVTGVGLREAAKKVSETCEVCQRNNPRGRKETSGHQRIGNGPGEEWQVDFTELPRQQGMRYLLVFVDTFSNWVECFPCRTAQAREVVKALLREIIPRFGLPKGIGSDNGPHFIAQITQKVSEFLGISWHLHTPWRPQSSGKVERMNQTLKRHLAKICQEARLKWPEALPLDLLRVRVAPHSKLGLSPFEIMYAGTGRAADTEPVSYPGKSIITWKLRSCERLERGTT